MVKKVLTLALILLMAWTSLGLGVEATPTMGTVSIVATYDATVSSTDVKTSADTFLACLEVGAKDIKSAMQFDTTSIPDTADVQTLTLTWKCQLRTEDKIFVKWDSDATNVVDVTGANMQTYIGTTTWVTVNPTVVGTTYTTALGATAQTDLETDLSAGRNWWAIGLRTTNAGWQQYMDSLETVGGQDPTLNVSFIVPGSYNYRFTDRTYENGATWDASYSLILTETDAQASTLTVDGETYVYCDSPLDFITWPIGNDLYRSKYSDNLVLYGSGINYCYVPASGSTVGIYQFTLKDYSNIIQDPSYLEAWRVVSASSVNVAGQEVRDTLNGIPIPLQYGAVYEVLVRVGSTTYSQGWILAGDDLDINILLKEMTFSQTAQLSYKWVTVEAQRPNATWIQFSWENTLTPDYDITAGTTYLYYRNGTLVTSSSSSAESGTFNYYTADNVTDYRVKWVASHEYLGSIQYEKVLPGLEASASDFPDLSVLGTFGGVDMSKILAYISLFIVAGGVSFISVPLGALGLISLTGFYAWRQVIPIDSTFLWTVMGLVALIFLASRRSG